MCLVNAEAWVLFSSTTQQWFVYSLESGREKTQQTGSAEMSDYEQLIMHGSVVQREDQ